MTPALLLAALVLFQVKHYLADFHWQTRWMVETKGHYGQPGGLVHAGLHGLLSLPVLIVAAPWSPAVFAMLVIAEVVLHYHIDWAKVQIVERRGISERDSAFWHFLGLDQAAHQLTYLAMLYVLVLAV